MICQLKCLEEAVVEFSFIERLAKHALRKLLLKLQRLKSVCSRKAKNVCLCHDNHGKTIHNDNSDRPVISPLKLEAGEKVRVKSLMEIKMTLDGNNKYRGLSYTPSMEKYCGGTYTVFKKLERVFDERKWKLTKIKNVVILGGVFCDGAGGIRKDWDGCDRSCFIWWKEGWLERVSE